MIRILVVQALDHLSKGSLVDYADDLVSISDLLADLRKILPVLISYRVLVVTANISNRKYPLVH